MKELIEILEQFDKNRNDKHNSRNKEKWDSNAVANCFRHCAEEILCNGYFLVNNQFIIDIGAIELYYHEEEGEIKDHIMYHTNEHLPAKYKEIIKTKHDGGYPYFQLGSFNLHTSGVDVTFENPHEKYRASFLIRSYRVLEGEEDLTNTEKPFDACSTHLFDDMFYSGIMLGSETIKWVKSNNKRGTVKPDVRKNVAWYLKETSEKGLDKYVKVSRTDYEDNKNGIQLEIPKPKFFKYGKNEYLQDPRLWQFRREGIKEEK